MLDILIGIWHGVGGTFRSFVGCVMRGVLYLLSCLLLPLLSPDLNGSECGRNLEGWKTDGRLRNIVFPSVP
jgi:hypothetical protein